MRQIRFFVLLIFALVGAVRAIAQQQEDPMLTKGTPPFQPMDGTNENINLSNGNVNVTIPLLHLKGRGGFDFDLHVSFDTKNYHLVPQYDEGTGSQEGALWDWADTTSTFNLPTLSFGRGIQIDGETAAENCPMSYTYTDRSGQPHNFGAVPGNGYCSVIGNPTLSVPISGGQGYEGAEAAGPTGVTGYYIDLRNPADAIVYEPDGTQVHFKDPGQYLAYDFTTDGPSRGTFTKIVDRNGNMITQAYTDWNVHSITDTVGRVISFSPDESGNQTVSYKDSNGALKTITISNTVSAGPIVEVTASGCAGSPGFPGYGDTQGTHSPYLDNWNITIPADADNGQANARSYVVTADSLGEITNVTYPTGGSTGYTYQTLVTADHDINCSHVDLREIYQKTTSDGTVTTYTPTLPSISAYGGYLNATMTVDYASGREDFHQFVDPSLGYPREYDVEVDTTDTNSGTMIRKVTYAPYNAAVRPGTVTTTQTVLDGTTTLTSQKVVTNTAVTTGGPLLPTSEVDTGYQGETLLSRSTSYLSGGAYDSRFMKTLVSSQTVNGVVTSYGYDEVPTTPSGATQHLAIQSLGNMTSVIRHPTPSTTLTTNSTYDDAGNVLSTTTPGLHTTHYDYADSFEPSATCAPASGNAAIAPHTVTNAKGQISTYTYFSCTGLPRSVTDPNGNTTSMTYDALGRMTSATPPTGGGSTTLVYQDSSPASVTTTSAIDGSQSLVKVDQYDGLGRESQSQTGTGPNAIVITTGYDGDNNVISKANGLGGTNTYGFDVLDRPVLTTTAASGTIQTSYAGDVVDILDMAGNHTRRISDAAGRLREVLEPDAGNTPSIETDYTYDSLGNLHQVDQWGGAHGSSGDRQRIFNYDNLARLTSSSNPESGLISYVYDPDGNIQAKTDAIRTTLFCYDQLERLVSKSFADSSCPTSPGTGTAPSSSYMSPNSYVKMTYDDASTGYLTQHNLVGRLSLAISALGVDGLDWHGRAFSYDALGRVTDTPEGFPDDDFGSFSRNTQYHYDLAGDITSLTYPDGRIVVQTWNSMRQLDSVTSGGQSFVLSASHFPSSPSITYGNGVTVQNLLSDTGKPGEVIVGNSTERLMDLNYCYSASSYDDCNEPETSDGPLYAFNLLIDYDSSLPLGSDNRSYTYDRMNRLKTFQHPNMPLTSYATDSWGNMSPMGLTETPVNQFAGADNKISNLNCFGLDGVHQYDALGNQLCTGNQAWGTLQQYSYSQDNQVAAVYKGGATTPAASYIYSAQGERIQKKMTDGTWTDYSWSNGQVLTEKKSDGTSVDYIYANGQKIARVDENPLVLHMHGVCGSCTSGAENRKFSSSPVVGYTIQDGDRLVLSQKQINAHGGVYLLMTDGSNSMCNCMDDDSGTGCMNDFQQDDGAWHSRSIDLSAWAGKTIAQIGTSVGDDTPSGTWDMYFSKIALVGPYGEVTSIYNGQASLGTTAWTSSPGEVAEVTTIHSTDPQIATTYYTQDPLGTAQLELSAGGWPTWKGDFDPWGVELPNAQFTNNNYKFTGKERDAESGLDSFQFRSFASVMGRWMHPDPLGLGAMSTSDPQSFNLYAYVKNNPLAYVDPLGLDCVFSYTHGAYHANYQNTNEKDCSRAGGRWVPGTLTDYKFDRKTHKATVEWANKDADGNITRTSASYSPTNPGPEPPALSRADIDMPESSGNEDSAKDSSKTKPDRNGMNQLVPAFEAQEQTEFYLTNRYLLPGAMIFSGVTVAGASAVATVAACTTVVGCVAVVGTVPAFLGGVTLAGEGIYYGIHQDFYNPIKP